MRTLYVFGNEHLPEDMLARKVAAHLEGFEMRHCRAPDDLLDAEREILILDVMKGIDEPLLLTDISKLKVNKMVSLHDFDLAQFLLLMKSLGIEKKTTICAIPQKGDVKSLAKKVGVLLENV